MVKPLDVIPSSHQALRNSMRKIDDAAYKSEQKTAIWPLRWSSFVFSAKF